MKISKNDPRLTAYVLNELDALEKSMIENALKADPELQSEVALTKTQREKIFEKPASSSGWSLWTIGGSLATASLALILFQQKAHETKKAAVAKDEAPASSASAQARMRHQELPLQLDVSLSQFLPTESEPADVEINMSLTRDLKKCFSENFSKYVRYNLKFNLNWNMLKTKPTNVQIADPMSTGLITAEIRSCVKQGFESQNWSEVKYIREALKPIQFEAVVSIVSE